MDELLTPTTNTGRFEKKDLVGGKYGRLTVLTYMGIGKNRSAIWKCICDCGETKQIYSHMLTTGRTKSCGCLKKEQQKKSVTRHGLSKTRLYRCWRSMHERCEREEYRDYKYYGARGIKVCDEWSTIQAFYDWAVANGYQEHLTIERLDVNDGYKPENCTWIPKTEQWKNTRQNNPIYYVNAYKEQQQQIH